MKERLNLIPAQRRERILEFLLQHGGASIQQLVDTLRISASTIRRDLEWLEEDGNIRRTHGGAVVPSAMHSTFEPTAAIAAQLSRPEKEAIGRAAAQSLEAGDSVIFDSGSTVLCAAQLAVERRIALTAVTNDLGTGQVLAASDKIHLVVLGGSVRRGSLTLIGEPAQSFIGELHADVAFIGVHSICGRLLTETSIEIASIKRAIIGAARRVVLLADSTKFQPAVFARICDITAVHELITDSRADPHQLAMLRDLGLKVTTVEAPTGKPPP